MLATLSVPWMCEMSKHSIRRGAFRQIERVLKRLPDRLRGRLQHAEPLVEAVLRVRFDQREHRLLLAALRRVDLDFAAPLFR